MELDKNLTSIFAHLCNSLSKENVQFMDYLLHVNLRHRWPKLEQLETTTVLKKMEELGLLKVDIQCRKCHLSSLMFLLDKIGRRDLSAAVENFGLLIYDCSTFADLLYYSVYVSHFNY